jgi:putative ABC transport system permease protein
MNLRKVLLISQFTLSLFFILTLIVIYNQFTLFVHQDHGFNMRSNILVRLNNTSYQALKTELSKYNNITSVSAASHVPAAGTSYGQGFKRKLEDPEWTNLGYFLVDENYLENMNLKLLAGVFWIKMKSVKFIVINEQWLEIPFNSDLDALNQEVFSR